MKVLIVGSGLSPTGRSLWLRDHLIGLGVDFEYRQLGDEIQGKQAVLIGTNDFNGIERRIENAIIYGTSHPEMYWPEPVKEPSPDKQKGPKGPRKRWGKL